MSTPFYDLASLVVVPSGYKASKVYAQKPLTTDGQLTFSRASTATRITSTGALETVSSNVPRLDYTNSSCPKILLEPQRTQKLTYSNTFTNAAWNKAYQGTGLEPVITANYGTDPFGGNNASRVQLNLNGGTTSSDRSWILQNFSPSATVTLSMYIKLNTAGTRTLVFADSGAATVTVNSTSWTRISQVQSGGSGEFRFGLVGGYSENTLDASICYAQCEEGSYPTSVIVSTTAAVTRLADTASKTGVSSLVGGTEGTMFIEGFQNSPVTCVPFQLSDGTNNNRVQIEISSVGAPLCVVSSGGATQAVIVGSSKAVGTNRKIAITFKANEFKLYENGQLIGTDTSGSIPVSLSAIYLGSESGSVYTGFTYKQILDFKTVLTEAQAKELTAL